MTRMILIGCVALAMFALAIASTTSEASAGIFWCRTCVSVHSLAGR